jgi:tRNA(fMet)-specific endonuclease VapC
MIVVDTDVLIKILDRRSMRADEALRKILESDDKISITAINLHEIMYGLHRYAEPVRELPRLPVLDYRKEDARGSARIEAEAEKAGTPIRRTDAMIAAVTINNGASLYRLDLGDFRPLRAHGIDSQKESTSPDSRSLEL